MTTPTENKNERTNRPNYWLRAIEFRKHQLGREYRATLGDKAREGVSDEDYATTMATLEKMARNLGWDETQADAVKGRGFGPGFGHGHGHRHPGMMRGFGPRGFHGPFGNEHDEEHGHDDQAPETKPEA
jgi:hypothetical protein